MLKQWNMDRISINPQSYTQATLDAIGRHHTVEETVEKFWLAREMGMDNINMDLIIGLPGETAETFARSLAETGKLMPESLTVHTLSFKRASEMTRNRDKYTVAGREEIAKMMQMATAGARNRLRPLLSVPPEKHPRQPGERRIRQTRPGKPVQHPDHRGNAVDHRARLRRVKQVGESGDRRNRPLRQPEGTAQL